MHENRNRITEIFIERAKQLFKDKPSFDGFEIVQGHDVHAFYKFNDGTVEHVQGYPGMSEDNIMRISARLRKYDAMIIERAKPRVSIGNEHHSNIRGAFPKLGACPVEVQYNVKSLNDTLNGDRRTQDAS